MAMAMLVPWLAWLLVSLLAAYFLELYAHARRGLPPGPRPLPLIGNLHLVGDQPHRSLARLAQLHGPLMSLRLGAVTTVVISSPDVAREFLQRHDAVFANRFVPHAVGDHADNSVPWLPHSARWRALRKIMATELFAPQRLDALQHLRRHKVDELVAHVRLLALQGSAVDVGRVAFATSLNLLSRTVFSCDLTNLDDDHAGSRGFQEVVTEIMEVAASPNLSDLFPALAWADLQGLRRRLAKLFARLHQVFDVEIRRRLCERDACDPRRNDFLDVLLDTTTSTALGRDTLLSLFTDLFAAGSDTSSSTVEWALTELLRNPVSMVKTCNELGAAIGSARNIEESEIDQLPYLQAVIKETFRLHPPVPLLLPRRAEATTEIMGHIIPKGARVLVNVWAMGRDKDIWPEPETFMPERFLERTTTDFKGGNFELIPFGAGRRICPGMPLASRMVHLVLASLLNQFKWRLPNELETNGIDMAENFGVTLKKATPLCAIATPV
ncbi:geraniol 8-hydroxylase [Sorghum bicolor]|uniref:Cytochrome P450 n=1 Tax=Sorghum bicolor TaxID=4558 RepID=A0A1B6QHA1_SORBI|nr:geraniol 8-hydroxylase [Sorghum bicolor]KXG37294.1 hypothetical protein SORBI_3001G044100 [Sorghum bicolor]|eukprot:XP_002463677.2 geraniol 8-hydroxylase [Sorghum bicolor]